MSLQVTATIALYASVVISPFFARATEGQMILLTSFEQGHVLFKDPKVMGGVVLEFEPLQCKNGGQGCNVTIFLLSASLFLA